MSRELLTIPLSNIRVNQMALRSVNQTSEEFQQIVDSIRTNGVLNPINVRRKATGQGDKPDGKEFEITDGLHRYTGSLVAGLKDIPAQVIDATDAAALEAQIIGNVHRVATKPIEYTKGLIRLLSYNPTMTEAELAAKLSVSPQFIGARLSLTKLDPKVAELVNSGEINLANAFPLTKLPPEEQIQWVEKAITMGTSEFGPQVHERAKALRDQKRQGKEGQKIEFTPTPYLRKLKELKDEYTNPSAASVICASVKPTTAEAAFALGVAWSLNMDPQAQQEQRDREAARVKKAEEDKVRRKAESDAKKATEAQKKQADLEAQAAESAAAAAKLQGASGTPA